MFSGMIRRAARFSGRPFFGGNVKKKFSKKMLAAGIMAYMMCISTLLPYNI